MAKYIVTAEGGGDATIEAEDDEIEQLATEWVQDGDWGTPRSYATVTVQEVNDEGEMVGEEASYEVIVGDDEEEPDCIEGEDHDWQSPEWLGGCRENPGVWGLSGTQITSLRVCAHCGKYRDYVSESTPGNYPRTPPATTYRDADERSEEWVKEMTEGNT